MIKFQEEIRNIAKGREKRAEENGTEHGVRVKTVIKEVMERFFNLAELGVSIYNESSNNGKLSVYRLPGELLDLFLSLPGKHSGFCLVASEKFVIFLDEEPDQVLVLGSKKQQLGAEGNVLSRARQLIRITCVRTGDGFTFKDNTGTPLDPEEIMMHIIKWAVS
jgi:hypothetical protein